MTSLNALTAAFLAMVARPERDASPEVERLRRKNEKLERSQLLLMEHIEILSDELRVARLRVAEEHEVNRRLTAAVSQHYQQQAFAQDAQLQQYAQLQASQGLQLAQAQAFRDCTCVPGRSAALRG